ncbi:MAG: signal peptidase II [Magnetococcales bacterium]|nr:signal peptidase II [Magnetococcales bacterium]
MKPAHSMMRWGLVMAALVLVLDQLTKVWASADLMGRKIVLVQNYFDLILVHNLGAAFGMFAGLDPVWRLLFLTSVAVLAMGLILYLLWQSQDLWGASSLGMVLGGAIGNQIDRLRLGYVVDFIHLHWHDLSWPVFNIADSAITVGIGMLLWESFRKPEGSSL